MIGKRYSVRILGKYLVIIANPAKHSDARAVSCLAALPQIVF